MYCGRTMLQVHMPKTGGTSLRAMLEARDTGRRKDQRGGHTPAFRMRDLMIGRVVLGTVRPAPQWYVSLYTHAANGPAPNLEALDMWAGIEGRTAREREQDPAPFAACVRGWADPASAPIHDSIEYGAVVMKLPRMWPTYIRRTGWGLASWLCAYMYSTEGVWTEGRSDGALNLLDRVLLTSELSSFGAEVGHVEHANSGRQRAQRTGRVMPPHDWRDWYDDDLLALVQWSDGRIMDWACIRDVSVAMGDM